MSAELKFDYSYEILQNKIDKYDFNFKIIIIGNSGIGKSSITNRGTKNIFYNDFSSTIGFENYSFNIKLYEKIIHLHIWDTCGQEKFRSLIRNFYRKASLAFIVYSVTDRESFEQVDTWIREIKDNTDNPDIKIFLIGNKIDLENLRVVQTEEGQKYAEENNLDKFVEVSAKSGFNAQNIFIEAAKILYDDYLFYNKDTKISTKNNNKNNGVNLNDGNVNRRRKCC